MPPASSHARVRSLASSEGKEAAEFLSVWFRRVVGSDESAFESLFRALHDDLLSHAVRILGDAAAARDVVQDAFVKFWERRREHDPTGSVRALLHRTVRNLALNQIRDGRRRDELLAENYEPSRSRPPEPDASLAGRELETRIQGWISELPDRQREALTLSRFQGLSHEEIARVMEVTPRTVNNHLVRALRTLRDRIDTQDPPRPPNG